MNECRDEICGVRDVVVGMLSVYADFLCRLSLPGNYFCSSIACTAEWCGLYPVSFVALSGVVLTERAQGVCRTVPRSAASVGSGQAAREGGFGVGGTDGVAVARFDHTQYSTQDTAWTSCGGGNGGAGECGEVVRQKPQERGRVGEGDSGAERVVRGSVTADVGIKCGG